jgi:hypothetical protein
MYSLNSKFSRLQVHSNSRRKSFYRGPTQSLPSLDYLCGFEGSRTISSWSCSVSEIPTRFMNTHQYVNVMRNNITAEYVQSIKNALKDAGKSFAEGSEWMDFVRHHDEDHGDQMFIPNADFAKSSLSQHIIQLEDVDTLVMCTFSKDNVMAVKGLGSKLPLRGRVRSLGYVGSFALQYSACSQLLEEGDNPLTKMILDPSIQYNGPSTYRSSKVCLVTKVPCNETQQEAVINLRPGLDVIHGPPGTGKSTTIWHIINSRLQNNAQCLVTCTRNQAVDSAVLKIASFGVLVFGNEDRLGDNAKQYTMNGRLASDPSLCYWEGVQKKVYEFESCVKKFRENASKSVIQKYSGLQRFQRESKDSTSGKNCASLWFLALSSSLYETRMKKWNLTAKLNRWSDLLNKSSGMLKMIYARQYEIRKTDMYKNTRVYFCTIDSTSRMQATLSEEGINLSLDTCIVDEAGCVMETAIPVLLGFHPKNLILIGDHQQLQPFSAIQVDKNDETNHCQSLLERAVKAGIQPWFLSVQYRMHPTNVKVVSDLFYDGNLVTGKPFVTNSGCVAIDVKGAEVVHDKRGYSNPREAIQVLHLVKNMISKLDSSKVITIITFYNKQRNLIKDLCNDDDDVSSQMERINILSIDACQGSESDYVIISTVRSDAVGKFMEDTRRLCVAFSRAKSLCVLVGNLNNLVKNGSSNWKSIVKSYPIIGINK